MHPNYAIWMIGGLQPELRSVGREREQRHEVQESRRSSHPSLAARLRGLRPARADQADLAGCPA